MKNILNHIALMIIISIFVRFYLYSFSGPVWFGDATEYIEVINNIYNGRGFSRFDCVEGKVIPYSNKMPLFFYISALSGYLFGKNFPNNIIIINLLSSILIIILTVMLAFYLTKDKKISLLSGWLMTFNPNLISNSMLIMSDTLYSLIIIIFTFAIIRAVDKNDKKFFFLSGLLLGISVLTRAVLKFYWIIIILFMLLNKRYNTQEKKMFITAFLAGYFLLIIPYHIRNYIKLNRISPLEFHQGIASLWPVMPLLKKMDPHQFSKNPDISSIVEFLKKYELPPEKEIMMKFNLNSVDMAEKLTAIAITAIIKDPVGYAKLYIRQLFNTITSAGSTLMIIDMLKPGFFNRQHAEFLNFINERKITKNVILNLALRILNFIAVILASFGLLIFVKRNKVVGVYILIFFSYVILFSSLTVSYDRYRLPVEFIISIGISYFLLYTEWFKKMYRAIVAY